MLWFVCMAAACWWSCTNCAINRKRNATTEKTGPHSQLMVTDMSRHWGTNCLHCYWYLLFYARHIRLWRSMGKRWTFHGLVIIEKSGSTCVIDYCLLFLCFFFPKFPLIMMNTEQAANINFGKLNSHSFTHYMRLESVERLRNCLF